MSDSRDDEREQGRRAPAGNRSSADPSAALSAAMDGELERADREALDRALEGDEALASQARELEAVDASLRKLAESGGLSEEALLERFEALRSRLAESEAGRDSNAAASRGTDEATRTPRPREARAEPNEPGLARLDLRRRDRRGVGPVLLAAAAALVLYLLSTLAPSVPGDDVDGLAPPRVVEGPAADADEEQAAEQALALGYGEEPNGVTLAPGIPIEDLEIIEELEILEFLAARAAEGRG